MPPLILLAGGLATRMRPLTEKVPKALLDVGGEPFIAHQLRLLAGEGIDRVVICTGYLGEMIEDFVGDGARFGIRVSYSPDGPALLGTGGALVRALPQVEDLFLVMYGDSYLPCAFAPIVEAFRTSEALGVMTVFRNEGRWEKSNVEFDGAMLHRYDKFNPTPAMSHVDYGLSGFRREAFSGYADTAPFDLYVVFADLVQRKMLMGYEVSERFYEIGSQQGLAETDIYLRSQSI
ncbi:nucleotidyl transferase [Ferrovibrio terrae]|uniref:Nucleotidyl transferase n=2 Tax=Ferrovibrio terrae TaxID=2594003 RepID=A0A516H764_9PROT|nr:nucleotidyl transferase [Ferrovibrio terrae]